MKYNYIKTLAAAAGASIYLCFSAFGGELGSLSNITDDVVADGENGVITSKVTGITGTDGKLALPLYGDAALVNAEAQAGTLRGQPEEAAYGDSAYLVAQFDEKETEVSLTLHWSQEETYKMKAAKAV